MNGQSLGYPELEDAIRCCVYEQDNLFTFLKCNAVCLYIYNTTKLKMIGAKKKNLIHSDKPQKICYLLFNFHSPQIFIIRNQQKITAVYNILPTGIS